MTSGFSEIDLRFWEIAQLEKFIKIIPISLSSSLIIPLDGIPRLQLSNVEGIFRVCPIGNLPEASIITWRLKLEVKPYLYNEIGV